MRKCMNCKVHSFHVLCSPYSMDVMTIPQGTGSGFVWDAEGHVVTNYHVVRSANALKVTLYDSSSVSATVVGSDETKDIAVLKLDLPADKAKSLKKVSVGKSSALAVGQKVFAIGNPFGLDHTLTQVRLCIAVLAAHMHAGSASGMRWSGVRCDRQTRDM